MSLLRPMISAFDSKRVTNGQYRISHLIAFSLRYLSVVNCARLIRSLENSKNWSDFDVSFYGTGLSNKIEMGRIQLLHGFSRLTSVKHIRFSERFIQDCSRS